MKVSELPPIEYLWDLHSRPVPEDGYDAETELAWLMGKNVFFKEDFDKCVKQLFDELYEQIKHGDEEHQTWLRQKIDELKLV